MRNETCFLNAAEKYTCSMIKKRDSYNIVTEHNKDLW